MSGLSKLCSPGRSMTSPAAAAVTARVWDIPRRFICDWVPPDWGLPPGRRWWALTNPDPACQVHGTLDGDPS